MSSVIKGEALRELLEQKADQYNQHSFIEADPICIPHRFTKRQDIEIAGLFAATLAWGQRKTIIKKSLELMAMMDDAPHHFILNHQEKDLKVIAKFCHRTFSGTDALYFVDFLKRFYSAHQSLEELFEPAFRNGGAKEALIVFRNRFFDVAYAPARTKKHVSSPARKSACKRLNMYLRWMVRQDNRGVDFGCWNKIPMSKLMAPVDLHVERVARKLKLIKRKQVDWETAEELTANLRKFNSNDPVRYDFALFGLGMMERF